MLCSQGCFTPGLGPLPLMGCSRIRAPISEQRGEFWEAKCRNITGTPRPGVLAGLGKGSGWSLGATLVPPWGSWQGQQLVLNRRDQRICHMEKVKCCQGAEETATAFIWVPTKMVWG